VHVIDHEPQGWFLFKDGIALLIDVNCSHGAVGYSIMIQLNAEEEFEYSLKGHAFLNWLAQAVQDSGPGSDYQLRDVSATYGKESLTAVSEWQAATNWRSETGGESCACQEALQRSYTSVQTALTGKSMSAIITGSELIAKSNEKWMSLYRCRTCGTLWVEGSYDRGQVFFFYLFPAPPTDDPVRWLHEKAAELPYVWRW
jgi:hypothetical protein